MTGGTIYDVKACEVLQITDGYVYFHTGADPTDPDFVIDTMNSDSEAPLGTLLASGDILGQASYVRPVDRYIGRAGILTRPINEVFAASPPSGKSYYNETDSATILVVPSRFNRLLLDLRLKTNDIAAATVSVAFKMIDYDTNSQYSDSRVGVQSAFSQIVSKNVEESTFRGTYEFPCPNPGRYRVTLELNVTEGEFDGDQESFLQLFHEVWM